MAKSKHYAFPLYRTRLYRERRCLIPVGMPVVNSAEVPAAIALHIIGDSPVEKMLVIYRGPADDYRGCEIVAMGNMEASGFSPRDLFRGAIVANALGIILAHNHPSGDVRPSTDDIETTRKAKLAGSLLGIDVVDHVIVSAAGDWHSLVNAGEMP